MNDRNAENNTPDVPEDGDEAQLKARFPDIEKDERLRIATGIPPVPEVNYQRPAAEDQKSLLARNPRLKAMATDVQGVGAASTIGITLALCIIFGTGIGWAADNALHTKGTPWGLITGFLIGTVAGFVSLIRTVSRLN